MAVRGRAEIAGISVGRPPGAANKSPVCGEFWKDHASGANHTLGTRFRGRLPTQSRRSTCCNIKNKCHCRRCLRYMTWALSLALAPLNSCAAISTRGCQRADDVLCKDQPNVPISIPETLDTRDGGIRRLYCR
jgi:hypothetical protein